MGRYATTTSISLLMPGFLSGNTTSSDAEGTNVWSSCCDRAEAEVTAALVARYDPSTWTSTGSPAIPPMVRSLTEDIACLFAMRRAMVQDSQIKNPNIPEWEKSLERLDMIRDGREKLAYTNGSLVPTKASVKIRSSTDGFNHVFGMDSPRAWGVGTEQLDDINSERQAGGCQTSSDYEDPFL